jgi:energy-coupling factor transporter ATP-binding protein EcfA2
VTNLPRIEAIQLHQVGVFDDMRLEFPPIASPEQDAKKAELHVFTGPNGCGKSTVLYALAEIFNPEIDLKNGLIETRFRRNANVILAFAGGHVSYGNQFKIEPLLEESLNNMRWLTAPDLHHYHSLARQSRTSSTIKASFAVFSYSGWRTLEDKQPAAISELTASPFENALTFDLTVRPKILLQWIANNRTQSALAKADGDLAAAQVYDQALARITNLIKDVCDLDVEFKLNRSPLAVTMKINGDLIHFDSLPDGLKSIISWVADLSLRLEAVPWENPGDVFAQPIFLFLDEVDIHLHPKWQRRILPAIQKLLPNAQVFVSTHSPFVVGSVEDAWVYRLPEPGSGITEVKAIPAGAGKSYRLILEEVFDIDTEFDIETEATFAELYQARQDFLQNPANDQPLLDAARWLQARSPEAALIVSRELRQVSRLTGKELSRA